MLGAVSVSVTLAAVYEVDRLEAETEAGVVSPRLLVIFAAEPRNERAHKETCAAWPPAQTLNDSLVHTRRLIDHQETDG